MSEPQPIKVYSLAELSETLDSAGKTAPPAVPTVRVAKLPDRPQSWWGNQPATTAANSKWWLNADGEKPSVSKPEPKAYDVELCPPPVAPPARSGIIDWRLVTKAAVAATVVMSVMVFAAWAATGNVAQPVAERQAVEPAVQASTAFPVLGDANDALGSASIEVAQVLDKQPTPEDIRLLEMDRQFTDMVSRLEAKIQNLEQQKRVPVVMEPACKDGVCKTKGSYGTAAMFVSNPAEAAEKAFVAKKMMLVLTISGNFEDSKFT
jgi:hypothetical protein